MTEPVRMAAVDLGAESGRVVLGRFDGQRIELELAHRFANRPLWLPEGLRWNLPALFVETLHGLGAAAASGTLDSIGVDSWGCDYALLDAGERLLGLPLNHRDGRTTTELVAQTHARVSRDELYTRTGIQTMPINTIFQLCAEAASGALAVAERIALIPDLIGKWLTGTLANELTVASTSGLLEASSMRWIEDLIARLGLPAAPFRGVAVAPGTPLGPVLARHGDEAGAAVGTPVHTVAGHDTASAFVAAPLGSDGAAVLSSGTWSLLGLELERPELGSGAAAYNLTNERGVGRTVRLLRNVMGLWLLQECRRAWAHTGSEFEYRQLQQLARESRADVALFDPDHETLLHGGDMPAKIERLCTAGGQRATGGPGEMCRAILTSLACKYRLVLAQLELVSGRRIDVVHVVGGGAHNELLCQLTADVLGRPVVAGPVEATALGNLLVQGMALDLVGDLAHARAITRRSVELRTYEPERTGLGEETFHRFLSVTGLASVAPTKTVA
ncbi:MAG: rhamnulokinase [Solirubrobacteraceae bacterium]